VELDDATALGAGDALLSDMQISGAEARGAASQASSTTGVLDQAPVRLSIIPTPAIAKPLDLITYEITACNDSPLQATGVVISVFVPRGTTLISVQDGGVNGVAGELRWNISSIDAATCSTVSFVTRMSSGGSYPGDGTVIFASARVIVDGGDTATANTAIRACMGDPTTCPVKPPPPCAAPQTRACNRTASDALSTLRFSVGQPITLRCPPCL